MHFELSEATADHLQVIRDLAHRIWPDAFAAILSREQIAYMLEMMYSLPSLQRQLNEGHNVFLLVKESRNGYAGFASYEMDYKSSGSCKLHKLYILPEMQGRGIGKLLIDEIKRRAADKGQHSILLNVNRHNPAVHFYKRYGFAIAAEEDIAIGNGYYMNDFVMELLLDPC